MNRHTRVTTPDAPAPAGPYSPGMTFERLVFVAGQGARNPQTGELAGSDIESQTEQCLKNVETILKAAGSSLQHVLRCGVFLIDIGEFSRMNAVYAPLKGSPLLSPTAYPAAVWGVPGVGSMP